MAGRLARRAAPRGSAGAAGDRRPRERQGSGAALRPVPRRRHPARARRCGPRARSWASTARFGLAFAKSQAAAGDELPAGGDGLLLAGRPGQAGRGGRGPAVRAAGLPAGGHLRDGGLLRSRRGSGRHPGGQGQRRRTARRRGRPQPVGPAGAAAVEATAGPGTPKGSTPWPCIRDGKVDLVVNTPRGRGPRADGAYIRRAANQHRVACLTTVAAARAAAAGIADRAASPLQVRSLQEYHESEQLPLS